MQSCVNKAIVQPDDFKDLTFFCVIGGKPFLAKGLRKFKHPRCQFRVFIPRTVQHIRLQLDCGEPIPHLRLFAIERGLVDLILNPQIEQPVLLSSDQRLLSLQLGPLRTGICRSNSASVTRVRACPALLYCVQR